MKKFHDEFFKKGSSEHDRLVLDCVSPDGKLKIVKAVEETFPKFFRIGDYDLNYTSFLMPGFVVKNQMVGKTKIGVCNPAWAKWCDGNFHFWRNLQNRCAHSYSIGKNVFKWSSECENFKDTNTNAPEPDKEKLQLSGCVPQEVPVLLQNANLKLEHETEVICKAPSSGFIIGYADILLKLKGFCDVFADLRSFTPGKIWGNFEKYNFDDRILVEVKPSIEEWGSVLRQIKTYMNCLKVSLACIVTYSKLDSKAIQLLKQESIVVIKFEKGIPSTQKPF